MWIKRIFLNLERYSESYHDQMRLVGHWKMKGFNLLKKKFKFQNQVQLLVQFGINVFQKYDNKP